MAGPAYFVGGLAIAKNWDWIHAFVLQDNVTAPIDLTDVELRMMIRKHETDHEALISITSANADPSYQTSSIVVHSPENGFFTIVIKRKSMGRLFPGHYVSDLVLTRPDGVQYRLWDASPTEVYDGVTRP